MLPAIKTQQSPPAEGAVTRLANVAVQNCPAPVVSVVISLYNYSAFIVACLDSVRASKTDGLPGGFEVIVVDDGSTDDSARVVEEYLKMHSLPITLIKRKANTGVSDTRNTGLLAARAPFVFILDADNEIRPECLSAHYQAITTSGCAMAYGHIHRYEDRTRHSLGVMSNLPWDERELVRQPMIDTMAMFRKETLLQVGGYSTEYGTLLPQGWEDYDLCLKLAQAGHAGQMIPQILSDYRVHGSSLLQAVLPFQHELSHYFTRKFYALAHRYEDLPMWFGTSRAEVAMTLGQFNRLQHRPTARPVRFFQRVLGHKLCRSLRKRLATVYGWLLP